MEPHGFNPELDDRAKSAEAVRPPDLAYVEELLASLQEMVKSSAKDRELSDKIHYSRLPVALFHATTQDNADRIMREGLVPSGMIEDNKEAVSLSDSIAYAKFCASTTQEVDPSELVIFEITTEGLDRSRTDSYLQLENPIDPSEPLHEVHYLDTIDPDWIYALAPNEVAELEAAEKARIA